MIKANCTSVPIALHFTLNKYTTVTNTVWKREVCDAYYASYANVPKIFKFVLIGEEKKSQ